MQNVQQEDLISSVLSAYQLKAGIYDNPRFCGLWQHSTAGMRRAAFHLIGSGGCWVHTRLELEPRRLEAGDLVALPHDDWHMLTAQPKLQGDAVRHVVEGEGPFTTMVCGYFDFEAGQHNPVLDALPPLIIVPGADGGRPMAVLSELLLSESECEDIGTRTVLDKLADALFVVVVRYYINSSSNPKGVLAGLADPRLRKALAAMHRAPGEHWTLETLAQQAGMSRTSFAQAFNERLGMPPFDYLTRWRMTRAELQLRNPGVSVGRVAEEMGYETEAAFRKAFKRVHGVGPGSIRRWLRDKLSDAPAA